MLFFELELCQFDKIQFQLEKILKSIYLHSPRETFTLGFFGFDITKLKEYKNADIIHIHWLNQGFITLTIHFESAMEAFSTSDLQKKERKS